MSLGSTIKKLRKEHKLTQKQLGKLIGKSEITVRKYESNSIIPTLETLNNIAKNLSCDLDTLTFASFGEVEQKEIDSLSHIYDFIADFSKARGKEFILYEKYANDILEFTWNVVSLLENKIDKIEKDMTVIKDGDN